MNLDRLDPKIYSAAIYDRCAKRKKRESAAFDHARLLYVLSGELSYTADGEKSKPLTSGSLLYVPAGVACAIKGQYLRAALIALDPERDGAVSAPFDKVIHIDEFESAADEVVRICDLALSGDVYSSAKAEAIMKLLLVKIAEASDESALPLRMTETLDEYIREHVGEEISNTEVGAIFGYHPFYVSTVMKEKRGVTLHQYVVAYRMRLAKNMLECTDKTVAEIAEETGFTDASYFTKSFKAAFGKTPKEWRNEIGEDLI